MNYAMIGYMLGWVCCFEAIFMLPPFIVSLLYKETSGSAFLITAVLCAFVGFIAVRKKPENRTIYSREGFVTVALSWGVLSIFGAVPYVLSGEIPSVMDALFESVSGFTTTGANIVTELGSKSSSCLFWRSFTQWIGGMGVLVFILAFLPANSHGSNMHLIRAEVPGPSVSKLVPRVRTTAKILYTIYIGMTLLEIIFLLLAGMPLFDAITISFGTASTGGFAVKEGSIGGYSTLIQTIIAIFMIMFGINFNMYYLFLRKKIKQAFQSMEFIAYLGIILLCSLVVMVNILPVFPSVFEALHHAFCQVAAIITSTGYVTTDYNVWPEFSRTILIILMFIGACAGSTGGGIKISRIIILLKGVRKEIGILGHPRGIKKVKMDGRIIEHEVVRAVNSFMEIYFIIFAISLLMISFDNFDMTTNFTAIAASMNNTGVGLELIGPEGSFVQFSNLSKAVLMFDMLAGRLELLPLLILFVPSTWKR